MEEMIKQYMAKYEISREEAIELINDDEAVDKMTVSEINKSYTKEERQAIKEATATGTHKKSVDRKPREVKINDDKVAVISAIAETLKAQGFENVTVTNIQKYISFQKNGNEYELNLVQKRPPKAK